MKRKYLRLPSALLLSHTHKNLSYRARRLLLTMATPMILRIIAWPFLAILNLTIMIIIFPIAAVYGAVYFCLHPSANARMRRRYMPPVQTYLDHFQRLHPDLMERISQHASQDREGWVDRELEMWPNSAKGFFRWSVANHESCPAAILFAGLEHAGWSRKVIWDLLRDQVEGAGLVNKEEKRALARAMSTMCDHQLTEKAAAMLRWSQRHGFLNQQEAVTLPEMDIESGQQVVEASADSLAWILEEGKVVRPPRTITGQELARMVKLEAEFSTVWGYTSEPASTRSRYWQTLDFPNEVLD
ncbi:hypothetical protein BJX66DRAFT_320119, partial [Aspergillus keveii]